MHEEIVQVAVVWSCVLLGGKPSKSFTEDENAKGVDSVDEHVNSEVKLEVVDKIWLVKVSLDDILLVVFEVNAVEVASKEYASALARRCRLDDEGLCLLFGKLAFEVAQFVGQDPGLGRELELV